jgi:hypothetical protein
MENIKITNCNSFNFNEQYQEQYMGPRGNSVGKLLKLILEDCLSKEACIRPIVNNEVTSLWYTVIIG